MRKHATYEGIIENGRGRLPSHARVPEKTRVDVFLPDVESLLARHVAGPHLADPQQAKDFQQQVTEDVTETGG